MKIILFAMLSFFAVQANANYSCIKTKDGMLICKPTIKTF